MKKTRIFIISVILFTAVLLFLTGFKRSADLSKVNNDYSGKNPKYIFFFIGDGMGLPQVGSTEIYAGAMSKSKYPDAPRALSFTKFPAQGITTTHDASSFITDSASSATALATGNKTLNGVINMDVDKKVKYQTIAQKLKEKGKKIGIISSVSIDHATPACFYSSVPSRSMMYEISLQLSESGFDYFAGGSVVDPDGKKSKMQNKPGNVFDYAKSKGYKVVNNKNDFMKLSKTDGKIWAVTEEPVDAESMLYEIDRPEDRLSLADFTKKGIELLDNKNGFFMMVEGGKIDWACHANDGMSAIKDVFAFDEAIKAAIDFASKHQNDTLIVVTGDHECGGMTIGFAGSKYNTFFENLSNQKISYIKFDEKFIELKKQNPSFEKIFPIIKEYFGLTANGTGKGMDLSEYELKLLKDAFTESMKDKKERSNNDDAYLNYGGYEPLSVTITHILNRKAGIGWTTYSHTGVPVPTYAMGVGNELFDGYYDNTDIYKKMASIAKVK